MLPIDRNMAQRSRPCVDARPLGLTPRREGATGHFDLCAVAPSRQKRQLAQAVTALQAQVTALVAQGQGS